MGHIAQDMTRLANEIAGLREKRTAFTKELQNGVRELRGQVHEMQAGVRAAHAAMARKVKDEGAAFVSHLRETVGGLRHEFAADLAGAHLAWFGAGAVGHRAMGRKEAGPGTEAKKSRKGRTA